SGSSLLPTSIDATLTASRTVLRNATSCFLDITVLRSQPRVRRTGFRSEFCSLLSSFSTIWATLVLLGIEKLRVIKGFTGASMLDSYFHPYSHSLIIAWRGQALRVSFI